MIFMKSKIPDRVRHIEKFINNIYFIIDNKLQLQQFTYFCKKHKLTIVPRTGDVLVEEHEVDNVNDIIEMLSNNAKQKPISVDVYCLDVEEFHCGRITIVKGV